MVALLLVCARWGRAIVFFGDDGSSDSTSNTNSYCSSTQNFEVGCFTKVLVLSTFVVNDSDRELDWNRFDRVGVSCIAVLRYIENDLTDYPDQDWIR